MLLCFFYLSDTTALMKAAENGHFKICQVLISAGADVPPPPGADVNAIDCVFVSSSPSTDAGANAAHATNS
jgi:ankyrin repeat protein